MAKTNQALAKVSINSPQSMANFATVLKRFIVDRQLFTNIKGKNYVNVEGWEFAGASIGIYPVVKEVTNESNGDEVKYSCRVELVNISNEKIVGAGVAICSTKESSKRTFDEYAIASMAQTRAIGKAYRNAFGWLMKMAGYEPTTAEEMTEALAPAEPPEVLEPIEEVKARVNAKLEAMTTVERLRALKTYRHTDPKQLSDANWRGLDLDLAESSKAS